MNFKLTFNRPAVRQFIEGGEGRGLKIKIENGTVMFMPSNVDGDDTASLNPRTRGGYESIVEGSGADEVLKHLNNPSGPFFVLRRVGKDWVAAEPYHGKDAPPKFEPHVRVWHSSQPKHVTKKTSAPKRATPKAQVVAAEPMDIADRVRWAYTKLGEERRPGRPSREFMEARQIKDSFEAVAVEFISDLGTKIDVKAAVEAHRQLTAFLAIAAPEALLQGDAPIKKRAPRKAKVVEEAKIVEPAAEMVRTNGKTDDEESEGQIREALQKLGLEEKPGPRSKRIRGRVQVDAFNGVHDLATA
jgi:hypothetical protein